MNGDKHGMDYSLLPLLFDSFNVKAKKRPEVLETLQFLEVESLNAMRAKG